MADTFVQVEFSITLCDIIHAPAVVDRYEVIAGSVDKTDGDGRILGQGINGTYLSECESEEDAAHHGRAIHGPGGQAKL